MAGSRLSSSISSQPPRATADELKVSDNGVRMFLLELA